MTGPLSIRPEQPGDHDNVLAVTRAAFGEEGELIARLIDSLTAAGHTRASLLAERDGEVVGHVQLSRSWLDAEAALVEVVVLSPLSVHPAAQNGGVGHALLQAACRAANDLGAPAVLLEGDPGYYSRSGFEPAAAHGVTPPSVRIPAAACQIRTLGGWRPEFAGALVYCDPFWALDCVGLRGEQLAAARLHLERSP